MTRGLAYGLIIAAVLGLWITDRGNAFNRGAAHQARKERDAQLRALTTATKAADTVYDRDTVLVRTTRTRYDSVRVTDTLVRTVQLPGGRDSVIVYVPRATADSTVNACTAAIQSCDIRVALRDTTIATLRAEIASRPIVVPRPWSASVLYDPVAMQLGAMITRDVWRFRVSAGYTPGRVFVGAGVKF